MVANTSRCGEGINFFSNVLNDHHIAMLMPAQIGTTKHLDRSLVVFKYIFSKKRKTLKSTIVQSGSKTQVHKWYMWKKMRFPQFKTPLLA
jgi:hypothetical protein